MMRVQSVCVFSIAGDMSSLNTCTAFAVHCQFCIATTEHYPSTSSFEACKKHKWVLPGTQMTPASSACVQEWIPQPLKVQASRLDSFPWQTTLSIQIGPVPLPNGSSDLYHLHRMKRRMKSHMKGCLTAQMASWKPNILRGAYGRSGKNCVVQSGKLHVNIASITTL